MEIDGSNPKLRYIEIEEFTALIRFRLAIIEKMPDLRQA